MNAAWSLILLVAGIVLAALITSYLLSKTHLPVAAWVPIGISVASIAISVLSTFKSDLFDFSLQLIGGDFALIHSTDANYRHSGVLLPLHFVNRGYGEGAILGISVEVTNHVKNEKYLLNPIAEVDLPKLIQNAGRIHATNIIGPFLSFPLASKQVVSRWYAFGWENNNPKYAQPHLEAGAYTFDVFVRSDRSNSPQKLLTFNHAFSQEQINSFMSGSAIYNLKSSAFDN